MRQARLVKQKELLARDEQANTPQTKQASPVNATVESVTTALATVKEWVKERRGTVEQLSAREQFNALFSSG